ncbi:F-box protein GID2-like [Mangifera indica]|uniref:F-box protein GID2-like n=1 Tax=Mangifera indica TaxID=29780 RepID=UPI001CFB16D9|nr:F-box protein GID2-like [Mangifera indica]
MKRTVFDSADSGDDPKMKKVKHIEDEEEEEEVKETGLMNLDENLLFEVLKHVDAKTLATAACVNKQWYKTCQDERLWELICTRHLANVGCGTQQLRSVVLALGGFRRLHSLYLCHRVVGSKQPQRWGKDEVHLSLSLLSIRYYEKMNSSNRGS